MAMRTSVLKTKNVAAASVNFDGRRAAAVPLEELPGTDISSVATVIADDSDDVTPRNPSRSRRLLTSTSAAARLACNSTVR